MKEYILNTLSQTLKARDNFAKHSRYTECREEVLAASYMTVVLCANRVNLPQFEILPLSFEVISSIGRQ